jgi:hypothetical protein
MRYNLGRCSRLSEGDELVLGQPRDLRETRRDQVPPADRATSPLYTPTGPFSRRRPNPCARHRRGLNPFSFLTLAKTEIPCIISRLADAETPRHGTI